MLREIVQVISKTQASVAEGTLFCGNLLIDDNAKKCLEFLEEQEIIENSGYNNEVGKTINLELSIPQLAKMGYYHTKSDLIRKNKYHYPEDLFFVAELGQFSDQQNNPFYYRLRVIQNFITAIQLVAKHNYTDIDVEHALIVNEDKAVLVPFIYDVSQIENMSIDNAIRIKSVIAVFEDINTDKKLLYINEMIDFLSPVTEVVRFETLLRNVSDFADKCENAYQYYLRDFSYNKLKIELDSKALEFTQKIQGIINDSQTKLVTIPTAFVLVFAAFDFTDLNSVKNITAIISLFIFATLIQIFLNNQYSSLNFTTANIDAYKETFAKSNIERFAEKFSLIEDELKKQRTRLFVITWILWAIPVALMITWLILLANYKLTP